MLNVEVMSFFIVLTYLGNSLADNHGNKSSYELKRDALLSLDHITFSNDYDRRIRPHLHKEIPTAVKVNLAINSFSEFNAAAMDFTVNLYLRQMWNDPRLQLNTSNLSDNVHRSGITLSDKAIGDVWVPDLFFSNEKQSWRHDITTPNILLRVTEEGNILYSQRLSVRLDCLYDFTNFPMDIQTCRIEMHSYAYTTDDIIFVWSDHPLQFKDDIHVNIPEFTLDNVTAKNCTTRTITGAYTCIYAEFRLKRDIRFYLLNIYAPTIVVVILSFVNFFIDPVAVPARVSIGLITVLTITTQSVSLQERLPRVSYIKAVDVWLAMCLLFVFGSVLEYAFVNVLLQKERKRRRQEAEQLIGESKRNTNTSFLGSIDSVDQVDGSVSSVDVQIENHVISTKVKHLAWDANKVDRASKYVFFVGFVVFNIGYWFLYLLLLAN